MKESKPRENIEIPLKLRPLRYVDKYIGVFTGKMVKPYKDQTTEDFKKDDIVVVMKGVHFKEWMESFDKLQDVSLEDIKKRENELESLKERK